MTSYSSGHRNVKSPNLKCFEVVDKDVWEPKVVDELQVDRKHGVQVRDVEVAEVGVGDVQPGLLPHHVEVAGELHAVLLKLSSWFNI